MDCPSWYQLFDEKVRIPRNLQWGHTFWEECLLNIEDKNLLLCPICRSPLPKQLKATKLPKNFIALEIARKHHEMIGNNKLCPNHQKEGLRYFWNTCQLLIWAECIFDHSGHEFVRREESGYVLKESAQEIIKSIEFNAEEIKQMLEKAQDGLKFLEKKEQTDWEKIDLEVERIIKNVQK